MHLANHATLVHLTVRCWPAVKTQDVPEHELLNPERDRVLHAQIPFHLLHPLRTHATRLRRMHLQLTTPWNDTGLRLLTNDRFFKYTQALRETREEYTQAIDQVLPALHQALDAQMSVDALRAKFGSALSFFPIPTGELPALANITERAVRDEILATVAQDNERNLKRAICHLAEALLKQYQKMQRCSDPRKFVELKADAEILWNGLRHVDAREDTLGTFRPFLLRIDADNAITALEAYLHEHQQ